jgi:CNT family concentrative nucleoside transporter
LAGRDHGRRLIGQKVVINEFVAYLQLADIVNGKTMGVMLTDQGADRDLRAVRLRQLQLDRDPDRRHRRTGPRTSQPTSPASACARCSAARIATFMTATIAGVLSQFA